MIMTIVSDRLLKNIFTILLILPYTLLSAFYTLPIFHSHKNGCEYYEIQGINISLIKNSVYKIYHFKTNDFCIVCFWQIVQKSTSYITSIFQHPLSCNESISDYKTYPLYIIFSISFLSRDPPFMYDC